MRNSMTNPLTKISVKQQLLLLLLVMVSPVLLLHWYGNVRAEQILKRHVTNAYTELNKQNFALINRDIDSVKNTTYSIIQNSITQKFAQKQNESSYDRLNKYTEMEKLLAGYSTGVNGGEAIYYNFYVYDPNNDFSFAAQLPLAQSGVYFLSASNKPNWYEEAVLNKGSGSLQVIDAYVGINKQKTLAYVRAVNSIYQRNDLLGVLVVTKMDKKIGESLNSVSLPDGKIYFTDDHNQVLTSTEKGLINEEILLPPEYAKLTDTSGVTNFIDSDLIYVVNTNESLKQKLIYKIPVRSLLQQQSELKHVILYITVVYTVFVLMGMVYFWRSFMTPLQKLATFVRSYEPGKLVPMTPGKGRNDEVGVLISSMYDMARRLNTFIHYKYKMELKQKETQLQILYQQIDPHLLYNTLESIYWKISLEGSTESAEMVKELAKLMKIGLSRGRELIRLEEELEHAAAYIKLQQPRYEYEFQVIWNLDERIHDVLIPKITLQPLIENAIIHGIKNMGEDGEIMISTFDRGNTVMIRIEDNGYKEVNYEAIDRLLNEEEAQPSLGYGIRNIHQRIQLHFGRPYGLHYQRREIEGTAVTIVFPKTYEEGQRN
ncbi:histidine kinase [Paenibacillus sepulcri]|uniref:Histidine kinase n=1 Tax=Paenibacillus sepulcri TaxID=359917 RepID=A0ABS7C2K4_9BACL|nr:histidine kinase [Paenibacillus sepulcri]